MIDLSALPPPDVIEEVEVEAIVAAIKADLVAIMPSLAPVLQTETATTVKLIQAFAFRERLFRARVNDAARAVIAPLAIGTDLENIAASIGVERLVVTPANPTTGAPAVMESDEALLRRYMLAFDRPSAGSRDRYLYEAWTALPILGSVAVNGRAIHGRRGDVDIVVSGPGGRDVTDVELAKLRAALIASDVTPEAIAVSVLRAKRATYVAKLAIEVAAGPSPEVVRLATVERVRAATAARTIIGGEIPEGFLDGVAYGPGVIRAREIAPVSIAADPYTVPVCESIDITAEVRP